MRKFSNFRRDGTTKQIVIQSPEKEKWKRKREWEKNQEKNKRYKWCNWFNSPISDGIDPSREFPWKSLNNNKFRKIKEKTKKKEEKERKNQEWNQKQEL